jgi:phage tail sheath protein FI
MIYLKRRIGKVADTMLFEGNVEATWSRFRSRASLILEDVQARFGIQEFKLILDETTTTADLIDQNIMYAKIFVKPTRSIEFIAIDFIITKTGVQF